MDHISILLDDIKKATINPKNDDDNYFQYAIQTALNYEQIGRAPHK